ncbi:cytochrome P450 [Gordonia insulae]|uniref:Bifunctional cytochrome P450/NADPH--P450 reductase n=1 Tax=Gordonia insulae TaxID=2420509 RepID=A0A3G8JUS5_9ACTN|nr:cytochrome P450 [Gordonia insulae]AZG47910.1 Bifunctional cytochrome P450/NADPH--P450 reductase [Gordonia insulae]
MGRKPKNDWSGQSFPHAGRRKPFIGDLGVSDPRHPLLSLLEWGADLGPIYEMRIFRQNFVFVSGAELAAELCDESRFCKALPPAITALRHYAGDGLFTAYNDEPNWQLAHELLMPAFTKSAMQSYHPIMLETAAELFDYWDRQSGPVDVTRSMTKLTMETLSRAAFSHDFGSFTTSQPHPFVGAMVRALETGRRKGGLLTAPGGRLIGRYLDRRNAEQQAYVDKLLDDLIAERSGSDDQHDLLGIMLNTEHAETGEKLSALNIRYQILTFLVAGHETTSGALSFALYYLSRNPDCLAAAQREADEILGDDPAGVPTFEQVPKFRYIRRCLDEALRIWPTVPAFARSPREDTTLGDRYLMRPEDWAVIVLGQVHRDPAVWEDPDVYDPDRFLPANVKQRPAHSYKPFGAGLRACIGRQFALHEAVLVLACLLHRYDLAGDPGYELTVDERLTMVPQDFEVTLEPRRAPVTASPVS